jgi:hypothetical protein
MRTSRRSLRRGFSTPLMGASRLIMTLSKPESRFEITNRERQHGIYRTASSLLMALPRAKAWMAGTSPATTISIGRASNSLTDPYRSQ